MTDADESSFPSQYECTRVIVEKTEPEGIIVSNLGASSWILSAVEDRKRNYYMKGAMGSTTPVGLGMSLGTTDPVTVIDGDGSMLMLLGSLVTVAEQDPENLVIVVMNNSEFTTTGGQQSLGSLVNFSDIARSCGISSHRTATLEEFEAAYDSALSHAGPVVIDCNVTTDVPDEYPRPDYAHSYLKHRFRTAVTDTE